MFNFIKLITLILNKYAEEDASEILIKKNKSIAIAESCTGGLFSSLMTDISGSSKYIKANFVTYANESKIKYLGVKEETINSYGAVSNQTANEMVYGLLRETGCDYAIATTGIAGPSGGTKEKPVGLVYIGIGTKDNINIYKYNVNPKYPRLLIKYLFAKHTAKLLANFLKENEE